ncbi:MAG: GNAT family N-acetyltransferase [Gammaproteobacteria bacterium]|nr:GNAT family N-acetyltransferase [Gammaproteobacteria bacterium]MBQ0773037.1 GNAT family N-acetyltransferase [Gammaproteobacteria bacterium]
MASQQHHPNRDAATAIPSSHNAEQALSALRVLSLHSAAECQPWLSQWEVLWQQCANGNPYFHPHILLPAWQTLGDNGVALHLVFSEQTLIALFPTQTASRFRGLPARWHRAWGHLHCFSDEPLILLGHETPALDALLQHGQRTNVHGTSWLRLPADSPVAATFSNASSCDTRQVQRAALSPHVADYIPIDQHLSKKKRKEYARLWRRFEELGTLTFDAHRCEPNDNAIQGFLAIEESGWKGKQGTSLLSNPAEQAFSERMFANAANDGLLYLYQLTLNDTPVASLTALRSGEHLYLFKIGFDETYAHFSPGVLLMLEATRLWQTQEFTLIDSCAQPGHPMIDHLWYQRRSILRIHTDSGRGNGYGYGKLLLVFSRLISRWQMRKEQR